MCKETCPYRHGAVEIGDVPSTTEYVASPESEGTCMPVALKWLRPSAVWFPVVLACNPPLDTSTASARFRYVSTNSVPRIAFENARPAVNTHTSRPKIVGVYSTYLL